MRHSIRIGCVLILLLSCAMAKGVRPDSEKGSTRIAAWKQYLDHPSRTNGERLYSLLPNDRTRSTISDSSSFETIYGGVWSLEPLVIKQKRTAVRIAFKLFAICDADFCESLDQILGALIRVNPGMFLEELSNHRALIRHLGGLVANLGDDFVDQESKSAREVNARIACLKSVRKTSLRGIRDECIAALANRLR